MRTFRTTFRDKFLKYRAIRILTNNLTPDERAEMDIDLADIAHRSTRELRERSRELDAMLAEVIEAFGVTGTLEELLAPLADKPEPPTEGRAYRLVPKHRLEKLFKHYDRTLPVFPRLPPHARIGVDLYAIRSVPSVQIYQLEASLFEDMAMLWNETIDAQAAVDPQAPTTFLVKRAGALRRATVKAVFSLLEGYLNSLAFDIVLRRNVTASDEAKLREWDATRGKPLRLSLRDKFLQYPKIAMAAQHPPLQESTSPPLRYVLAAEQEVRHAFIHPTPQHDIEESPHPPREAIFFAQNLSDVGQLCDSAIDLISSIGQLVGSDFGDVSFWLRRRDEHGRFPAQTFD